MTVHPIRSILRFGFLFLVLASISTPLVAQRTSKEYRGLMGGNMQISMHLETEVEQLDEDGDLIEMIQYSGYYSYKSKGTPIPLYGSSRHYPRIMEVLPPLELQEQVNGELTGTFHGQFSSDGGFIGFWGNPDSTKVYPFVLYPVDFGDDAAQREMNALMAFVKKLQGAVSRNDRERVAGMVNFPLFVTGGVVGPRETEIDREDFLKHYGQLFNGEARSNMSTILPRDFYPFVSMLKTDKGIPDGTAIYYMTVGFGEGTGRVLTGFGFGRVEGTYKLLIVE